MSCLLSQSATWCSDYIGNKEECSAKLRWTIIYFIHVFKCHSGYISLSIIRVLWPRLEYCRSLKSHYSLSLIGHLHSHNQQRFLNCVSAILRKYLNVCRYCCSMLTCIMYCHKYDLLTIDISGFAKYLFGLSKTESRHFYMAANLTKGVYSSRLVGWWLIGWKFSFQNVFRTSCFRNF